MCRRGFIIGLLPPLLLMLGAVAIDFHAVSHQAGSGGVTLIAPAAGAQFPRPGPRRYPPAYRAGALARPYA